MEALNHPLLAPYKDQILATAKPSAEITLTRQDTGLKLWQSKVGGEPYLPKGADYPRHPDGHALTLLAQINFAEVPKLPDFPEKGILQFFIDGTDDLLGMDYGNPLLQNGFRVIYHADVSENIDDLVTDFSPYTVENTEDNLPFVGQYAMAFQLNEQLITDADYRFRKLLGLPEITNEEWENFSDDEKDKALEMPFYYRDFVTQTGHRMGGHPRFLQGDPRGDSSHWELHDYDVLLFQLDSDDADDKEIMWGDCGVANFCVHPDDLKKLDFSKILYNWDCY